MKLIAAIFLIALAVRAQIPPIPPPNTNHMGGVSTQAVETIVLTWDEPTNYVSRLYAATNICNDGATNWYYIGEGHPPVYVCPDMPEEFFRVCVRTNG